MKISLKTTGLPEFVQITIAREARRLLSHKLFSSNEKEDIIQELILYYLEHFHRQQVPNEAYVVTSLRNQATKLIRTKARQRFGLFLSLDDMETDPREVADDNDVSREDIRILLDDLTKGLTPKEYILLNLVKEGYSLDEIASKYRVSKNTIYKIFEKIKKNYKK